MVQISILISAVVLGRKAAGPRQAALVLLGVFAATLAIQTPLVASEDGLATGSDVVIYAVANAATLVIGLVLARWLLSRRGVTA